MSSLRPNPISMIALCVLSLALAGTAAAKPRDVRHAGANGDGGSCPDSAEEAIPARKAGKKAAAAPQKAKGATSTSYRGGNDDSGRLAPRWHSFLPGMFR